MSSMLVEPWACVQTMVDVIWSTTVIAKFAIGRRKGVFFSGSIPVLNEMVQNDAHAVERYLPLGPLVEIMLNSSLILHLIRFSNLNLIEYWQKSDFECPS